MTHLKAGDKAPIFKGKDQDGKDLSLTDLKGHKVILYFYPRDNTPGCTAESCNLRDNHADLTKRGFKVIGVSTDTEKSHQKFISKFDLPFDLIADTEMKLAKAFGVFGEKKFMGRTFDGIKRTTFVIDENGVIEKVFTKVKTKEHTEQILAEMES